MSKKPTNGPTCGTCAHGQPWTGPDGDPWNTRPDGQSITLHCVINGHTLRRGIFRSDAACKLYKKL